MELDTIVCEDRLGTMKDMPAECVDLIITSSPYYNAKDYAHWETYPSYLNFLEDTWKACHRILKIGGRIAVNILAGYNRAPWIPVSVDVTKQLENLFLLRGHVIWDKAQQNAGRTAWGSWMSASNPHFRDRHEVIIIGSKETFGKGYKGKSDILRDEFLIWTQSIWRFNAQSGSEHPAPFPEELPKRCIKLLSYVGDSVFDPFMGSGTTAVAALRLGRHFYGCDINPEYVELASKRIEKTRLEMAQMEMDLTNPTNGDIIISNPRPTPGRHK